MGHDQNLSYSPPTSRDSGVVHSLYVQGFQGSPRLMPQPDVQVDTSHTRHWSGLASNSTAKGSCAMPNRLHLMHYLRQATHWSRHDVSQSCRAPVTDGPVCRYPPGLSGHGRMGSSRAGRRCSAAARPGWPGPCRPAAHAGRPAPACTPASTHLSESRHDCFIERFT